MMEDRLGDLLHCDEQLRNTLHANDKEKLRQKLELLQREHRRTFQRLRRAERLDSGHGRIRSKVTPHNSHDQTKADVKSCSAVEQNGTMVQNQQLFSGVATAVNNTTEMKPQTIGSSRLSDTAYTPTSDSSQDSAQIPKASPALRLRSRRSRIRWAKRSSQSDRSPANCQDTLKLTEKVTEEQDNALLLKEATVLHESEELFSPPENEPPTLLLPHWNLQSQVEKEETTNQLPTLENGVDCEENLLSSASVLFDPIAKPPDTNGRTLSRCLDVCEKSKYHLDNTEKRNAQQRDKNESSQNAAEFQMEKPVREDGGKKLLESCTLVEGLLFPAEYYVRTTRRMAVSQSQPDINAIIMSHLSRGRPRRGRGRGATLNRTVSVAGVSACKDASENNSPSSCETPNRISCSLDGGVSPAVATPGRGRRGRRGRGRGRGRTARSKVDLKDNAGDAQADDTFPPKLGLTGEEAAPEDVLTKDTCGAATRVTRSEQVQALNGHQRPPAVLQNNQTPTNGLHQNAADWPRLLLPSSSQSDLPLLSPLPPIPLLKTLLGSQIQDFHLPDDQFASLKLLKLRQLIAGVEPFTPCNTPTRNHRTFSPQLTPLSLSPTPDIWKTVSKREVSVAQKDDAKISHSNEGQCIGADFDVPSEEKTELFCPCPEILNVTFTQEGKNGINSSVNQIKSKNLARDCKSTSDVESNALESIVSLPENLALNDSSVILPKIAIDKDVDCLNVEKENQDLESYSQPESQFSPKTITAFESSSKHLREAYSENIPNVTKKCNLESEKLCHSNPPTQLLLSPSLESASCPLTLPRLGLTPWMATEKTPAKSPPALSIPLVPKTTPEALSPCLTSPLTARPPSLPLTPPSLPSQAPSEPLKRGDSQLGATVPGHGEEAKSCAYTLKAPVGGRLVDVCCVASSSGSLWVAAAGTWAVCLWKSQGHPSDWSLSHTWSFEEPVISVFPVPDAPDLFCVTLGQLEIRQVRVLSCCSLAQTVLCDCVVQTAMGAPDSRVVCSSHTSTASIIRVFTLSHHTSPPHCLPLVSPGGSLISLAFVEGLPDALIGTDESDSLLIWNMKTGHLLQKVALGDGLSHSACLRAYSHNGALFAVMQLHSLGSLTRPGEGPDTEERGRALLSLLAINPRNGKSVQAARLCPPSGWSGRLCEADVLGPRLVGLSQRGSVCVWDLERPRDPPRAVDSTPEGEGWQLARWGGPHVLLTALHTGDITLHCYGDTQQITLWQQNTDDRKTRTS